MLTSSSSPAFSWSFWRGYQPSFLYVVGSSSPYEALLLLKTLPGASTLGWFTFFQLSGVSGACPQFGDDGKWLIHAATCLQRISAPVSSTRTSRRTVGSRKARQGSWRATPNTERCLVPPTPRLFAQIDDDEEESSKFISSHM